MSDKLDAIERRLAKIPADVATCVIRGQGLASLIADLRWAIKEVRRLRVDLKIEREFGHMGEIDNIFGAARRKAGK